jgi:(p)ppGpp synthase/HD superfamily hydrolase
MSQPSPLLILSSRYQDALQLAVEIHRHQSRKDTGIPYTAHLLNVSGLVLAHGGNEDEAIAALLHDSLEDHPDKITAADIELRFGSQVLQHVLDWIIEVAPNHAGRIENSSISRAS